jgi:pyruvate dehydrogenase E2 component (dihydrolipoamide acetyltransferase)
MSYEVLMPQQGMTMTEGSVVQWFKKPGEPVEKGEVLFIVQTDKADIEIEAPCTGTLGEILVELGKVVPVGTVVATIAEAGDEKLPGGRPRPVAEAAAPTPAQPAAPITSSDASGRATRTGPKGGNLASPRAQKLAKDLGVDISQVPDYGDHGCVVEADVQRFAKERAGTQPGSMAVAKETASTPGSAKQVPSSARKATAAKMVASFRDVPHFYLDVLADATELTKLRGDLENRIERDAGVRLSYTDLLLKALAHALREHPDVNLYWQEGLIVRKDTVHLGLATQTTDRLIVPVIRNVDRLSLAELARTRRELVARATAGKLGLADLEDASCTLSNLGPLGVDHFHAILDPPQATILAVGALKPRPLVVAGAVLVRQSVYLSLSVDHRIIDGAAAAMFLSSIARAVESPYALITDYEVLGVQRGCSRKGM